MDAVTTTPLPQRPPMQLIRWVSDESEESSHSYEHYNNLNEAERTRNFDDVIKLFHSKPETPFLNQISGNEENRDQFSQRKQVMNFNNNMCPDDQRFISFLERYEKEFDIFDCCQKKVGVDAEYAPAIEMSLAKNGLSSSGYQHVHSIATVNSKHNVRGQISQVPASAPNEVYEPSLINLESHNMKQRKGQSDNIVPRKLSKNKEPKPVRPLSAYNYFFSDEREKILSMSTDNAIFNEDRKLKLILRHISKNRSKPRKHRKTHGKIDFKTLSREIGQRWKKLPEDKKEFYRNVAATDVERYRLEVSNRAE